MIRFVLAAAVALPLLAAGTTSFASVDGTAITKMDQSTVDRRRPRVPGGSGCDTPRDIRQHPECRA